MDMASNFVKELRDLVKKKPKNGTVASLTSLEDDEETDSPLTPRKFKQSFLDVQVKIRDLKSQISSQSKKNFTLDKDLRFLDSKIALLINHKISIEEIESRVFDDDSSSSSALPIALKGPLRLELYGQLFFLLQTSPEYIAHLSRMVSLKEIDGLLQIVMFTLYGNQYEDREEHLLLSMFEHTLTYEVQEATEINSLMRANTAITRMMTNYCRRGPGQEYVKSSLGVTLMELVNYAHSLEIDPVKIYQEMIDNDEVDGPSEPEKLLLEAEANPKVQQQIREHVPVLQEFVLSILHQLKDSIDEVPFGIRWLCKATRSLVMEKFPSAEVETINSFIGGFFFLRYINPIIATPHAYRLISNPPPHQTRRNLTLVVKVIQKLANTSHVRESYMKPLEPFVKAHNEELKSFLSDLCEIEDFHESLQLEEYIALCRQDIAIDITVAEMACLHSLLLKYREYIVSSPVDDPLAKILEELPVPGNEMMENKHVTLTLDLIQRTRDNLELPTFAPHGVSLDMTDELATARRRCKHLLTRVFGMAPHCLQEATLDQAVTEALSSPLKDVVSNAELSRTQLETLTHLGGLVHQGKDLYDEIKEAFPEQPFLLQKAKLELKSLNSVYMAMMEHCHYLEEQLDAYKEYLTAVRAKVGQVSGNAFRKPKGTYRFSHQQLEKEGVILETPGIPEQKRKGISYTMSCSEPGIYCISMMYKGQSKTVHEKTLHLEDLLELQHLRDPVIDMEGIVILNVRRTLLMLNRYFIRRDSGSHRPVSRHFSAPALTSLNTSKS